MRRRTVAWIAFALAGAVTVVSALDVMADRGELAGRPIAVLGDVLWGLLPAAFAWLAALIISNRSSNVIGWVLMIPGVSSAMESLLTLRLASFEMAPTRLDAGLFLTVWFENWAWVPLIFPVFHLLQVFPTGRILSPRWSWLFRLELLMAIVIIGAIGVSDELGPTDERWLVANPIGFLPVGFFGPVFSLVWTLGLLVLTIGGATSIVMRYRRAPAGERQQIKWLLYSVGIFVVVYSIGAVDQSFEGDEGMFHLLLPLSIILIPVAITLAILRYRLFDIDLIVRRTLVYTLLTGLLGAVYLGSVVLLQSLFRGQGNSSVSVAASTLLITALFTPLRRRIQALIDRRLYRSKYQAQQLIERFGTAAQNEANLETLSDDLMAVVAATIQPRSGVLWIREQA